MKYELSKQDVDTIREMIDITLKAGGLRALQGSINILNRLNSPIFEPKPEIKKEPKKESGEK